jgi:hypothetical protein
MQFTCYCSASDGPIELSNGPALYVTYQWIAVCFVASANPLCLPLYKRLAPKLPLENFTGPIGRQVKILLHF